MQGKEDRLRLSLRGALRRAAFAAPDIAAQYLIEVISSDQRDAMEYDLSYGVLGIYFATGWTR